MSELAKPAPTVRLFTTSDVTGALELSRAAGWNQTADDWRSQIALEPCTCFAIEQQGQLVSTTTLTCYGTKLAWVGMVLTRPEFRGQGFARRLLKHALAAADERGIGTLKLDATEQGRPLYEKLGFEAESEVMRWSGFGCEQATDPVSPTLSLENAAALDLQAFGADRRHLLEMLHSKSDCFSVRDGGNCKGYALSRPGDRARYLGPCIAADPNVAHCLIRSALAQHRGLWFWDLIADNRDAQAMASELGFRMERRLLRMRRGKALLSQTRFTYAIAGFEWG